MCHHRHHLQQHSLPVKSLLSLSPNYMQKVLKQFLRSPQDTSKSEYVHPLVTKLGTKYNNYINKGTCLSFPTTKRETECR